MKLSPPLQFLLFVLFLVLVSQIQLDNQFGDWNGVDHAAMHLTVRLS